tara:strand:+ start:725 stop:892 length:168 start_codon:yes stop_codon:yes gene_type:complete
MNPYFELGVEPGVSPQKLKQAYRQSVMRYHPDTGEGTATRINFDKLLKPISCCRK